MSRRTTSLPPILAALLCLCAMGAWAKSSDRNQNMKVSAGSSDCSVNESGPCIFSGGVHIVQGTLDIQSAKADLRRGAGGMQSVKLTGSPVKLKQQNDDGSWINATAAQIDYDLDKDIVVLSGNAVVQQPGRSRISNERIVYNMGTGQVQSGAAAGGGRVNMTFEPKNKASAGDKDEGDDAQPPKQDDE